MSWDQPLQRNNRLWRTSSTGGDADSPSRLRSRRDGGEGEIRTLDGPVTHNGFRDRRLQPDSATSPQTAVGAWNGGPDRIRTGALGLDRAACLARLHHGTGSG